MTSSDQAPAGHWESGFASLPIRRYAIPDSHFVDYPPMFRDDIWREAQIVLVQELSVRVVSVVNDMINNNVSGSELDTLDQLTKAGLVVACAHENQEFSVLADGLIFYIRKAEHD